MDEEGLSLNLNFLDQVGLTSHPKLDWRERKRQAHEKRNSRRQRGSGQARSPHVQGSHPRPAAAAVTTPAAADTSPAKRQKVQHASGHFNTKPAAAVGDSMHGYGDVASPAQPEQQQQQQQQQQERSDRPQQQLSSPAAAHYQQQQRVQGARQPEGRKAGGPPVKRPAGGAGAAGGGSRPAVVKGALAKLQESAEAAGPTADEEADIMALVALNLSRDQALQQEVGQTGPAGQEGATTGVVEFGDAEDEPDYAALAQKQQRRQQHKQQDTADAPATKGSKHSKGQPQQQQQGQQQPKQQLAQHKTGELTHAEPNVPAESRLQLFGRAADAAAGVTDDSTWQGLGLTEVLATHLEALNFQEPTQVQKQSIPVLLSGRDALVRSPTGSGKTLAYLAPMVHSLAGTQPRITRADGTHAVVLVPTRELAVQVADVLTALARRFCWLVSGILIGGEHRGHEKARLRKGVTILVATPGRLMDHLENTASFRTDNLRWLVLDEADRLLDLGFEAKLKAIIERFDSRSSNGADADAGTGSQSSRAHRRQTVLLSATLHPGLSVLAGLSLQDPVGVGFKAEVVDGQLQLATEGAADGKQQQEGQHGGKAALNGAGEIAFELPQQLKQKYVDVDAKMRLVYLIGVLQGRLRRSKASKMVVFFSNCDSVEFHHELFRHDLQLSHSGSHSQQGDAAEPVKLLGSVPVLKLHGDMLQPERTSSLVTFAKAKSCVLLCTDVAARGLDFPAVSTIIQYDPAGDPAEYVHRVGRTARMGQQGEAILFLLHSELPYIDLLEQRGMNLQRESDEAVLRCLPALLSASDPSAAGSIHRFAKKLRQEASTAAGDDSAGSKGKRSRQGAGPAGGMSGAQAEGQAAGLVLQRQLLLGISGDEELKQLALNAFRSFIRAYATHPSFLKHVFHIKSLHLGHLAASFGLKEAPTRIGASGASAERKKRKAQEHKATQKRQKAAWHKAAKAAVADG